MAFINMGRRISHVVRLGRKGYFENKSVKSGLNQIPVGGASVVAYHCGCVLFGRALYVDQEYAAVMADDAKNLSYPLQHVEIMTKNVSDDQSTSKEALRFNVAYIDTHAEADLSVPIVVTLHGAPGCHLDFKHIIEALPKNNVRVISLNFPGFNWTPMESGDKFEHTTLQKTVFLTDFLKAIKINKIDILVGHSAGTYPAINLCASTDLVRSLLLINPAGHRYMKSFSPWWYFQYHTKFCRTPILRPLLLTCLKLLLVLTNSPNKDALLMSAALETLAKVDFGQVQEAVSKLASKKFPIFIMFSENDHAVEAEISYELATTLGGSPDLMEHYDSEANIVQPISHKGDRIFRGYVFKKSGHFLTKRHPDLVNNAILKLLQDSKEMNFH